MRLKKILLLFIVSIIFTIGVANKTDAQGVKWLGTKRLPAKFLIECAKGNVPGHTIIHKFGKGNVGTTLVPVCASLDYKTPTTAIALEFVSSDVNDTSAGTGAREITLIGLDADWEEVTQIIATNGTTAVPLTTNLTRLYRWYVSKSGTYATIATNSHAGTLTVRVASAGATWSTIGILPRATAQSEIGCYSVPKGFRAYVFLQEVRVDSTKSADILFFYRSNADNITAPFDPWRIQANFVGVSGTSNPDTNAPRNGYSGACDIGYMGKIASGTADIMVDFEILLIEDGY